MKATWRRAIALLLVMLTLGMASCRNNEDLPVVLLTNEETSQVSQNPLVGAMAEVSPPKRLQQLKPYLDVYEPQVRIAFPRADDTVLSDTVSVEVQVRDFPIYKDQTWGLGPHLHLFLDNQPHQAIYDTDAAITLDRLSPGTHTLRLIAVRPWGESFKNAGAYDQVTFDVFAASPENNPDSSLPLLSYNQPQGSYGAEPILLDFYLANTPLHLVAQTDETVTDWKIRCTINGESFVFDQWQPIYLEGFQPGKNWIKLELIDENGNLIDNALNTSIRVIDYQPAGEDGLSQLVRGDIPLEQAKVLIDPDYEPPHRAPEEPAAAAPAPTPSANEPEAMKPEDTLPEIVEDGGMSPAKSTAPAESITPAEPEAAIEPAVDIETETPPAPESSPEVETAPAAVDTSPTAASPDAESDAIKLAPSADTADDSTTKKAPTASAASESATEQSPDNLESDRPAVPIEEKINKTDPDMSGLKAPSANTDAEIDQATPTTDEQAMPPVADTPESIILEPAPDPNGPTDSTTADRPKSNLDGLPADDLTEDSPLMQSRDSNFPAETQTAEPPVTTDAIDLPADGEVEKTNLPDTSASIAPATTAADDQLDKASPPDMDLKTLEDNADLI
ncbi:MAG: hypothetical protein ACFBSG_16565 [Leptolyngbyaceae cyanobacterium]